MRKSEIAATVRARRKASAQTQQRLAERLGVSVMRVSEWERGLARPSPRAVRGLVEHLGGGPEDYGREDD